jgi:hypothetical protein
MGMKRNPSFYGDLRSEGKVKKKYHEKRYSKKLGFPPKNSKSLKYTSFLDITFFT